MCDTQVLLSRGAVWFAKNSDREPDEPQPVIRVPAVRADPERRLRVTYIDVDQVPDRHAVILSKPSWIWGAEMGANDRGVVIGNEAIFSRVMESAPALLGMDLVRLGLERGGTAREALAVITSLLERHGQGGPAGYRDKRMHYDSSFLIADAGEAWILETAAREWVAKRVEHAAAISNCLTLGGDYDLHSSRLDVFARDRGRSAGERPVDFARAFDGRVIPWLAGAHRRLALSRRCLVQTAIAGASFERTAAHLRSHAGGSDDPLAGSNGDVCMHAAGPLRRSQSCGSMISRLAPGDARHFFTGTSAPCLSIFRPATFDDEPASVLTDERAPARAWLWRRHERVHRRALFDAGFRRRLREERDAAEAEIFRRASAAKLDHEALHDVDAIARRWQARQEELAVATTMRLPLRPAALFWRRLERQEEAHAVSP